MWSWLVDLWYLTSEKDSTLQMVNLVCFTHIKDKLYKNLLGPACTMHNYFFYLLNFYLNPQQLLMEVNNLKHFVNIS